MKTIINIKADKEVKEMAQKVAKELGVPLSTIINAQLKEFIRNKSVHLSIAPRMTPYLEKIVGKAMKDYKAGKNIAGPFHSAKEIDNYLNS